MVERGQGNEISVPLPALPRIDTSADGKEGRTGDGAEAFRQFEDTLHRIDVLRIIHPSCFDRGEAPRGIKRVR